MNDETLLMPQEAADLLRKRVQTLADWRAKKVGPDYVKVGHSVRYRMSAIRAYLDANTVTPEAVES